MSQTTIIISHISARLLGRFLRDYEMKTIAIKYYATDALDELLQQLPDPSPDETEPAP